MKKTVTALVFAAISVCAAGPLCAKTPAHKAAKADASADSASPYWQCVTFARQITGMQIFGDAWTWWEKATGKYEEGQTPKPGAVLVFHSQGKMRLGHVAVVSQIITDRYIQVTHANWSPVAGHRGRVEENVNVMDVSDRGDWSKVKVWYGPLNDLGTTVYTTYGFIYQDTLQGKAAARQMIAQSDGVADDGDTAPKTGQGSTQLAMADSASDIPDDLKAALTPSSRPATKTSKATLASAQVSGSVAHRIIAQIDADASDEPKADTAKTRKSSKSSKASSKPAKFHAVKLSAKEHTSKTKKGHSAKSEKTSSEKTKSAKKTETKKAGAKSSSAHEHKSAKKRH